MNNPYVAIFHNLSGDPTERVKLMLNQYANEWELGKSWLASLLNDSNTTAEDILDAMHVLVEDPSCIKALKQGYIAMKSGTQKFRREAAGLNDEKEDKKVAWMIRTAIAS